MANVFYKPRKPFKCVEGVGSPAWNRLDRGAVWMHLKFHDQFDGKNSNRHNLSMSYKQTAHEMSTRTHSRSIWQLIGFGFIDIVKRGRLERNCSLFGLSHRWRKLSEKPKTLDEIENILKKIERLKRDRGSVKKRMKIRALRDKIKNRV